MPASEFILVLSDWDGTASGKEGSKTIFDTPGYRNLFTPQSQILESGVVNFKITSELPSDIDLRDNYKDQYIYVNNQDSKQLYYINNQGVPEKVTINKTKEFEEVLDPNKNMGKSFQFGKNEIVEIITKNTGHIPPVAEDIQYRDWEWKETTEEMRLNQLVTLFGGAPYGTNYKERKDKWDKLEGDPKELLINPDAIEYYKEILAKEEDAKLYIITKNRADYVELMLKYTGAFTEEELKRITITSEFKDIAAKNAIEQITGHLDRYEKIRIDVLDDTKDDRNKMAAVANEFAKDNAQIKVNAPDFSAGKLDWELNAKTLGKSQITGKEDEIQKKYLGYVQKEFETLPKNMNLKFEKDNNDNFIITKNSDVEKSPFKVTVRKSSDKTALAVDIHYSNGVKDKYQIRANENNKLYVDSDTKPSFEEFLKFIKENELYFQLHTAINENNIDTVRDLLEKGANPYAHPPIVGAEKIIIEKITNEEIKNLLISKSPVASGVLETTNTPKTSKEEQIERYREIVWKIRGGQTEFAKGLLSDTSLDLSLINEKVFNKTLLVEAIEKNNEVVVKLLLENGAKIGPKEREAAKDKENIIKLLIPHLKTTEQIENYERIIQHIKNNNTEFAKSLLNADSTDLFLINEKFNDKSLLVWAIEKNNEVIVNLLLEKGAKIGPEEREAAKKTKHEINDILDKHTQQDSDQPAFKGFSYSNRVVIGPSDNTTRYTIAANIFPESRGDSGPRKDPTDKIAINKDSLLVIADENIQMRNFQPSLKQGETIEKVKDQQPDYFVKKSMDAGLKKGDTLNIVLFASNTYDDSGDSFAHKLAKAYANEGITTNIIASSAEVEASENFVGGKNVDIGIKEGTAYLLSTNAQDKTPKVEKITGLVGASPNGLYIQDPQQIEQIKEQNNKSLEPEKRQIEQIKPQIEEIKPQQQQGNKEFIQQSKNQKIKSGLYPFKVEYDKTAKTDAEKDKDAKEQAKQILNLGLVLNAEGLNEFYLTYSANENQYEKINEVYNKGQWNTGTNGEGQARVVHQIEELLQTPKYQHLQNVFRLLPIPTMKGAGADNKLAASKKSVNDSLDKAQHIINGGGVIIGWQNQDTPGSLPAIGGGISNTGDLETQKIKKNQLLQINEQFEQFENRKLDNGILYKIANMTLTNTYKHSVSNKDEDKRFHLFKASIDSAKSNPDFAKFKNQFQEMKGDYSGQSR